MIDKLVFIDHNTLYLQRDTIKIKRVPADEMLDHDPFEQAMMLVAVIDHALTEQSVKILMEELGSDIDTFHLLAEKIRVRKHKKIIPGRKKDTDKPARMRQTKFALQEAASGTD